MTQSADWDAIICEWNQSTEKPVLFARRWGISESSLRTVLREKLGPHYQSGHVSRTLVQSNVCREGYCGRCRILLAECTSLLAAQYHIIPNYDPEGAPIPGTEHRALCCGWCVEEITIPYKPTPVLPGDSAAQRLEHWAPPDSWIPEVPKRIRHAQPAILEISL